MGHPRGEWVPWLRHRRTEVSGALGLGPLHPRWEREGQCLPGLTPWTLTAP